MPFTELQRYMPMPIGHLSCYGMIFKGCKGTANNSNSECFFC